MSLPEPRLADHHEASSNRRTLRWTAIGRFGGIAAFAITTLQLASSLPSGDLAEYLVAQALAAFASGLSAGGENVTAMKIFAGSDPVERDGLLASWRPILRRRLLTSAIATAALCVAVGVALGQLGSQSFDFWQIGLVILTAWLLGWQMVAIEALRAVGRVRDANLGTGRNGGFVTQGSLAIGLGLYPILFGSLSLTSSLCLTTGAAAIGLVHLVLSFRAAATTKPETRPVRLPDSATNSPFATIGAQLLSSAVVQIDLLIAGVYFAGVGLATYGLARRIATVLAFPLQIGVLSVSPNIVIGLRSKNLKSLQDKLSRMATVAFAVTLAGSLLPILLPDSAWHAAGIQHVSLVKSIFLYLSLGQLVNVYTGACGTVLLLAGEQSVLAKHSLLTLVALAFLLVVTGLSHRISWFALAGSALTAARFLSLLVLTHRRTGIWTNVWRRKVIA